MKKRMKASADTPCNTPTPPTNKKNHLLLLRSLGLGLLRGDLLLESDALLLVGVHVAVVAVKLHRETLDGRRDRVGAERAEDVDDPLADVLLAARAEDRLRHLELVAALRRAVQGEVRAALAHDDADAALVREGAVVAVVATGQVPGLLAEPHAVAVLDERVAVAHDLPDKRRRHLTG